MQALVEFTVAKNKYPTFECCRECGIGTVFFFVFFMKTFDAGWWYNCKCVSKILLNNNSLFTVKEKTYSFFTAANRNTKTTTELLIKLILPCSRAEISQTHNCCG